MEHKEKLCIKGEYKIEIFKKDGTKEVREFENLITHNYLTYLLYNTINFGVSTYSVKMDYVALGKDDGTALPLAVNNLRLGNEIFRKQFTTVTPDYNNLRIVRTCMINSDEANDHIKEIGIFGGNGATSTANTGLMFSRTFFDYDKDELESIKITRIDSIGRL